MGKIQITSRGIKKALQKYKTEQALAEYIWNGFDAKASVVDIYTDENPLGGLKTISISDNGYGIPKTTLAEKFDPFFESEKALDPAVQRTTSLTHGKNGVGRLTFFKFAEEAIWTTVFEDDGKRYKYQVQIKATKLNDYESTEPEETDEPVGTVVWFYGIRDVVSHHMSTKISDYLAREFGWFLELNARKDYQIRFNEMPLNYSSLVGDRDSFTYQNSHDFEIDYVRWNGRTSSEYSNYYFIGSDDHERFKHTTTLNNKSDKFFHSIFIRSSFFDDVVAPMPLGEDELSRAPLFGIEKDSAYKELMKQVNLFLKKKRKPFLVKYTDQLVNDLRKNGAFPKFSNNEWDRIREEELESVVRNLYWLEPKIFSGLNNEQGKTLVHFLNLIIDSEERTNLLEVIDQIVKLEPSERAELGQLLKTSKLSNVIATIKLIEDRFRAVNDLQTMVFEPSAGANEPDHIQRFIERHYWIFGEQYHLVTSAEQKFEEALRRYIYHLRGEEQDVAIDHVD